MVKTLDDGLDVRGCHVGHEIVDPALDDIAQVGVLLLAVFRQVDVLGPLVARILLAVDEPLLLEHRHRARHDGLVEVEHRRELILPRALVVVDAQEHDVLRVRQMQLLARLDDKDLRAAVQHREPASYIDIFIHAAFLPKTPKTALSPGQTHTSRLSS